MPWNQPGSGGGKDPWGQNRGPKGPPDLDEIVKNVQDRIGGLFGSRGGNGARKGGGAQIPGKFGISLILILLFGAWIASGFYKVNQGETAVVLQFGKYKETKSAGLRWHYPSPIETAEKIDVQKINFVEVGYRQNIGSRQGTAVPREALMLTADENIIDIEFAIQYNIKDPTELLFNVSDPADVVVRGATESAVREIVGSNTMDFALTEGRSEVVAKTKALLQRILDRYQSGINIVKVNMQNAQPPAEVKDAFDDAVKAREDEQRIKNEAEAYSNDIIPRARGRAARLIQEAEAYKAAVIARAEGEASRFVQILEEYQKAPEITRDRLYIESMEQVLSNSSKLMIDQKGGNNVIYLPLDQLMRQRQSSGPGLGSSGSSDLPVAGDGDGFQRGSDLRSGRSESGRG